MSVISIGSGTIQQHGTDCASQEQSRCPRYPNILCISPGPIEGGCCKIIPDRPVSFGVVYRNPGHWDITTRWGRAFRIRGEPGKVMILDEREDRRKDLMGIELQRFKSVATALAWCAEELMSRGSERRD